MKQCGSEWIREMWQDCQAAFRAHLRLAARELSLPRCVLPGSIQEGEEGRRCSQGGDATQLAEWEKDVGC